MGLIIAAAWYAVPKLLEHIVRSRSRELFLLTVIVLCLGIAWLTSRRLVSRARRIYCRSCDIRIGI